MLGVQCQGIIQCCDNENYLLGSSKSFQLVHLKDADMVPGEVITFALMTVKSAGSELVSLLREIINFRRDVSFPV